MKNNKKQPDVYVPTREEFDEFCAHGMKLDDKEWIDAIWNLVSKAGWKKKNGEAPNHWHSLVSAYNGVLIAKRGRKPRLRVTKKVPQHEKTIINEIEETFPDNGLHYVAYTDGSCDNLSQTKAGGAAYIILKDGEILKMKNHGQLNTTNNRMELLAIISAVNACPNGAYVDIYTDSQYCILVLSKSYKPKKNPDLYESYKKCSAHLAGVRFHWVKGHNGDKYNEMVDNLAYGAYCDICEQYNIEKSKRH